MKLKMTTARLVFIAPKGLFLSLCRRPQKSDVRLSVLRPPSVRPIEKRYDLKKIGWETVSLALKGPKYILYCTGMDNIQPQHT